MKYEVPNVSNFELNQDLVDRLKLLFKSDRENRFELFLLSSGIRDRYIDPTTHTYPKEFKDNYTKWGLEDLFGKLPNFTKYSGSGDVINYIISEIEDYEKYLNVLPMSVGCMYQLSMILKGVDDELFRQLFYYTPKRRSVDEDPIEWKQDPESLINPWVTEEKLRTWFKRWNEPTKEVDPTPLKVPFLTITCHKDLFEFDRETGDKVGVLDLHEVETIFEKINGILEEHQVSFGLKDSMEKLRSRYERRKKQFDPTKHLQTVTQRDSRRYV